MGSAVFPVAVQSSTPNANTITCATANTLYSASFNVAAGSYTLTCVSSTIATIEFFNSSGQIAKATTASGTVSFTLTTPATRFTIFTNTGSNIICTLTFTGGIVTGSTSAVEVLTTSGTYTGTSPSGYAYVAVVGAGGGGGGGSNGSRGGGGGSGGISTAYVPLTGSISYTIGTGGIGGNRGQNAGTNGTDGNATTFGNITANGGAGGVQGASGALGGTGTFSNGGIGGGTAGATTAMIWTFLKSGTTGGGGQGDSSGGVTNGAGSGIGTGGAGAAYGSLAADGSGYGAGGGGGSAGSNWGPKTGGDGAPGVVYLLKF